MYSGAESYANKIQAHNLIFIDETDIEKECTGAASLCSAKYGRVSFLQTHCGQTREQNCTEFVQRVLE